MLRSQMVKKQKKTNIKPLIVLKVHDKKPKLVQLLLSSPLVALFTDGTTTALCGFALLNF